MRRWLAISLAAVFVLAIHGSSFAADPATAIDAFMRRTVPYGFSGSLLVARHGHILLAKGYGYADRDAKIPYDGNIVFSIGSVTKQFTAAAILKLETEGRLKVGDSIAKYLSGVPADKAKITIHELLTHTSGLQSDFGDGDYETVTRDEFLREVMASKLRSEPGKMFAYSNAGYGVLAAIVEAVSGEPYEKFLHDNLFVPAGMKHTGYPSFATDTASLAHGYAGGKDQGTVLGKIRSHPGPHWNLIGNGGILSTLNDLYRWDRALRANRIFTAEAKHELFTPYVDDGEEGSRYAYGWYVTETPWHTPLIAHTGGDGVFFAGIRRYVDDDVTIIHSSNVASLWSEYPVRFVEDIVFGKPYKLPPKTVAMPMEPQRFEGAFRLPSGSRIGVALVGNELRVTPAGEDVFAVFAGVADDASLEAHQAKTASILSKRDRGNFAPLADVMTDGSTAASLRDDWENYKRGQRAAWGEYQGFDVLGSRPAGSWTLTYVRLNFERGELLLEYLWNGDKLVGIQFSTYPGYFAFLPAGKSSFASYDIRSGQSVALAFAGKVMAIVSHGHLLAATRAQ